MTVGDVEIAVGAPCTAAGREFLPVRSTAEHVGLYGVFEPWHGEVESWLDAATGHPLTTHSHTETSKTIADVAVSFGGDAFRWQQIRQRADGSQNARTMVRTRPLPAHQPGHDLHSALATLREWAGEPDVRGVLHVVVGTTLWRVEAHVAGTEPFESRGTT